MSEKKVRPRLSQTQFLSLLFQHNQRPSQMLKKQITRDFEIPLKTVQIWFQNRRAKEKKGSALSPRRVQEKDPFSSLLPLPSSVLGQHTGYFSLFKRETKKHL